MTMNFLSETVENLMKWYNIYKHWKKKILYNSISTEKYPSLKVK